MPEKMKAVVKTKKAPGAEMLEVEVPKIKPNEVLIKIIATSICGTDVHIYEWDPWSQGRIKNIPQTLGHECAGEVVEVGAVLQGFNKHDRVVVNPLIYCGECHDCRRGQHIMCPKLGT